MSDRGYTSAILDACYIYHVQTIDPQCTDLIYYITEYYSDECVLDKSQYDRPKNPCYGQDHNCEHIETLITDRESMAFYYSYQGSLRLSRVFSHTRKNPGDPSDLKILGLADKTPNCIVLSCDDGVLHVCSDMGVDHRCLKASLVELDGYFGKNSIIGSGQFQTDHMVKGTTDIKCLDFLNPHGCLKCDPEFKCSFGKTRHR